MSVSACCVVREAPMSFPESTIQSSLIELIYVIVQ